MADRLNRVAATARLSAADTPFALELGGQVAPLVLSYETYGTLAPDRSNAILVCHALTGSAHAAGIGADGRGGWWDGLIGPGRALDTDRYYVVCANVLGSCYGTTGPNSIDPATARPYGEQFPAITIRDIVRSQRLLLEWLGVERLHAVIGGSMGGMQVLEWGALYPEYVELLIPIATAPAHSAWRIGFSAAVRGALALGLAGGDPDAGLRLARTIAMLSYRSDRELGRRFGRLTVGAHDATDEAASSPAPIGGDFAVEMWLRHHGDRLAARFDVATYHTLTHAMDTHDLARGRGELADVLAAITHPALVIGIASDVLYPEHEVIDLARALPNARYRAVDSVCGHDAFLIEVEQVASYVREFLEDHAGRASVLCLADATLALAAKAATRAAAPGAIVYDETTNYSTHDYKETP